MEQNKAKKEFFNISASIKKDNSLSIILSSLKKKVQFGSYLLDI